MKLLNLKELRQVLGGRGRTSIYRDVDAGRLPEPIKIGGRVYWRDDEIQASLEKLERNSDV
jgi:predicted DNA-binding transcriptional regulator AlpA